jgi:hypothetical protein
MINRILRDDPAKGLTALHNKISFADIRDAWSDKHLWPLILLGLCGFICQSPVQAYLTYNLRQLKFTTFQSNMLTVSCVRSNGNARMFLTWPSRHEPGTVGHASNLHHAGSQLVEWLLQRTSLVSAHEICSMTGY